MAQPVRPSVEDLEAARLERIAVALERIADALVAIGGHLRDDFVDVRVKTD